MSEEEKERRENCAIKISIVISEWGGGVGSASKTGTGEGARLRGGGGGNWGSGKEPIRVRHDVFSSSETRRALKKRDYSQGD